MEGQGPASADGDPEGDLYDSYLDGALAGAAEEPAAFLARHPGASPDVRARIERMHRSARRPAAAPRGAPRTAEPGLPYERLGEYRLLRRLGEGGMGLVFEAEQESLGRVVALKVLRPDLRLSPEARERFRREARAVARLRHPGIVSVLAAGEEAGVRWIALDLVPGRGLDELIAEEAPRGGVAPARAARWAARVARALEYAHARGVVHRDVKPSNIRIGPGDEPFLLDFGVAREEDGGPTLTGPFVGSVPWAAPEQLSGKPVDGRADVYGLGATLHHALTGSPPFAAPTVDRAIHRALHEEATPPGRSRPGIPADLDAVVLRALEKSPDDRYASAGALAEDLEAVLEFRPVRARPPGPVRRLRAWTRRHPALAAGAATALLAAAVLAGNAIASRAEERARVRRDAAAEVDLARARLGEFRTRGEEARALERETANLREMLESAWMSPEQAGDFDRKEAAVESLRREREAAFHGALDHLRRAERLDPAVAGVEEVRARLYLERSRDAEAARDAVGAGFFRDLARSHDADGKVLRDSAERGTVSFRADAPGAEVHLFRYLEQSSIVAGGERRLVPVPLRKAPIEPGSPALRVVRGAGGLRPGDLVLEAGGRAASLDAPETEEGDLRLAAEAGGLRARVLAGGAVREVTLPAGLLLRPTAAPVPPGPWSLLGTAPLENHPLEKGSWLAVFRAPGREDQRVTFGVFPGVASEVSVSLVPGGSVPAEFVRVPKQGGGHAILMDREVTCGEYLEFLNDPAVLGTVGTDGGRPRLVPRNRSSATSGHWERGPDGRFSLAEDWTRDWPVFGVSFEDARAYAAWRTQRDRPLGGRGTYALPTQEEWLEAGGVTDERYFVCGNVLRPWWVKSCFARRRAGPEPILRFPRDESPYGVHDMAGSVAEWCEQWYDRASGTRRVAGGSWAWGQMEQFKIWGAQGWSPASAGDETGFRLAIREEAR